LLTSSTTRLGTPESCRRQSVSGPSAAATAANRFRSSSTGIAIDDARTACLVKNHPESASA